MKRQSVTIANQQKKIKNPKNQNDNFICQKNTHSKTTKQLKIHIDTITKRTNNQKKKAKSEKRNQFKPKKGRKKERKTESSILKQSKTKQSM